MVESGSSGKDAGARRAELSYDVLVDAYFSAERWSRAVDTLRDYHEGTLRHLEARFGFCLDAFESSLRGDDGSGNLEPARDAESLISIMRSCLRHSTLFDPFGTYLEGGPGPLEKKLQRRYGRRFGTKIFALKKTYRKCFADALIMLAPHLRSMRIADDVFEVVGPEPDPDDFW